MRLRFTCMTRASYRLGDRGSDGGAQSKSTAILVQMAVDLLVVRRPPRSESLLSVL